MSDRITRSEYQEEIRSIADEAKKAVVEEGADLHDWIHETIDGHQWVIYTAYNHEVLAVCSNPDAGVEEGLIDANAAIKEGGMSRLTAQLAYCAMEEDVMREVGGWEPEECTYCGAAFDPDDDDETEKHDEGKCASEPDGDCVDCAAFGPDNCKQPDCVKPEEAAE